jgi:predicted glutamine amidotransferase
MCRLFGFRSVVKLPVHHSLREAENALAKQSRQHPDGWGIGYYLDGDPYLQKSATSAFRDYHYEQISEVLASETVIAHIRRATVGRLRAENSHPFLFQNWIFAHNGEVSAFDRARPNLMEAIPIDLAKCIHGDTDSEHVFHLFLGELRKRSGDLEATDVDPLHVRDALVETVRIVDDAVDAGAKETVDVSPLNFLVSNGSVFAAVRRGKDLFFSTQKKACSDYDACTRATKECLAPLGADGAINHLIVSSERISAEDVWEEMPAGSTLTVSRELDWRIDRLGRSGGGAFGQATGRQRFRDRTVVVSGAAGGLGRRIADAVAAEGAVAVLVDTDGHGLQAIASHIRLAGGKVFPALGDPSDPLSAGDLAQRIASACGAVDILIQASAWPITDLANALPAAPGARLVCLAGAEAVAGVPEGWARANAVDLNGSDEARVVPVMLFLASDESALLNGAVLPCSP